METLKSIGESRGHVIVRRVNTEAATWGSRLRFSKNEGLCKFSAVLVGHYVVCTSSHDKQSGVFYLDTRRWTWHEWPRAGFKFMYFPQYQANAVLVGDIIYRFGGLSQGIAEATPKLNMLDLPMRSVTVKRSSGERLIPKRLSAAAYVESEGDIVVFAGDISHNEYAPTDRLVGYSLSANTWRVLASKGTPPRNRAYHQCCTYGRNRIFFFGGISESRQFVEGIHELFHTRETWRWTHIPFSFPSRYRHSICCVGHKLFIFGGVKQSYTSPTNDLLVYDIINQESIEVQRQEVSDQKAGIYRTGALMATADHAVVASTDMIFVLGGVSRNINEVYTLRLNL